MLDPTSIGSRAFLSEAFASNFEAASSGCHVAAPPRRVSLPTAPAMSSAEVDEISGLLAEVQRSCQAFGEVTAEAPVRAKARRASQESGGGGGGKALGGADKRVEQKLHYFRDRADLVLPIIEDRYLTHDAKRDCSGAEVVLDLGRTGRVGRRSRC